MDFRLSDGPPLDPRELVHVQAAKMAGVDAPAQRFPSPAAPRRAGPKVLARACVGSAPLKRPGAPGERLSLCAWHQEWT